MHLSSSSAAGVRFLTSVREGRGLNRSAREAGIGKETGYRWLREAYVAYRRGGKSIAETEAVMGLASAKSIAWEAEVAAAGAGSPAHFDEHPGQSGYRPQRFFVCRKRGACQ